MRNPLTTTKAKREAIAKQIEEATALYRGVTTSRGEHDDGTEINLTVEIGPYRMTTWLYRDCAGQGLLGNWYTDFDDPGATYPADFAASINGSVNPYHRRKATMFADDVTGFLCLLGRGLECLEAELEPA